VKWLRLFHWAALQNVDEVILATSTVEEDDLLAQHTLGGRAKVWRGDPDDVTTSA